MARQNTDISVFARYVTKALIYFFLCSWAFTTLYLLFWVVNNSFKTSALVFSDSFSLAKSFDVSNYITAFSRLNIGRAYFNSIFISCCVVIGVIVFGGMSAYIMARYEFRMKKLIHAILVSSLLFPVYCTIVPVFEMLFKMKLINNYFGVILPQTAGNMAFAIIVLTSFMKTIPIEMEEAAYVEGYSTWQIFVKIILPLSKSSFATVGIFTFLWSYNDLFTSLIILRDPTYFPISNLLNEISSKYGTDYGLMAASVTLVIIPVLIVYLIGQKQIVKGLTAGAVKG
ncbi:carbohydrate ABC transporter permease [Vallitaleaceae bacterium 9-2]